VAVNDAEALRWIRSAADQRHPEAEHALGLLHGQGRGVPQDYGQAVYWYTRAARQGVVGAQDLMCMSYSLGRGVATDRVRAYAWCDIAVANGSRDAAEVRATLVESMDAGEIRRAEEVAAALVREFVRPAGPP